MTEIQPSLSLSRARALSLALSLSWHRRASPPRSSSWRPTLPSPSSSPTSSASSSSANQPSSRSAKNKQSPQVRRPCCTEEPQHVLYNKWFSCKKKEKLFFSLTVRKCVLWVHTVCNVGRLLIPVHSLLEKPGGQKTKNCFFFLSSRGSSMPRNCMYLCTYRSPKWHISLHIVCRSGGAKAGT